jgi:hypothetical protein
MSSTTARPSIPVGPSKTLVSILESNHMTATVNTESGNLYTVITRPKIGVILINEGKGSGCRIKGGKVQVIGGRMYLFNREGKQVANTTQILRINILTN